jgi:hypothetical protein
MFEFLLKDEFLPIYAHQSYSKMFKDQSVMVELSPDRRKSKILSPNRDSSISKMSRSNMSNNSPKKNLGLEMSKKGGIELRESPSKAAKIVLRYINSQPDVGPKI